MSARLSRIREERGVAIVIALATITVTAALAAALVAGAGTFLHSSSRDSYNKRALDAAQAGLNVALYRFGQISQSPSGSFANNCITDREVSWSNTTQHCAEATGYFNLTGATSSYTLTPDLSAALTGMPTVATDCGSSTAGERCITAIGTVNGVTRRVQERVKAAELFMIHGMTGLKEVNINSSESWSGPNFKITSDTGSNGAIKFGENVNVAPAPYHCELGPSPPASAPGSCTTVVRTSPITVPSVDSLPFGSTMTTNSNATIAEAEGYSPATRSLSVAAGKTVTLAAGDYNLCYVNLGEKATLLAAVGARVRVFIDSPSRTGSGCTSPTGGKFNAASKGAQVNLGETQGQLELYLYGTATPPPNLESPPPATCNADFTFVNKAAGPSANLYIYAPDSIVSLESNAYQMGAIVACQLTYWAQSASARWDYPPSGTRPSSGVVVTSGSFRECTPAYSGDQQSGCG
jgi:Tfp pilus assembly protein PilX